MDEGQSAGTSYISVVSTHHLEVSRAYFSSIMSFLNQILIILSMKGSLIFIFCLLYDYCIGFFFLYWCNKKYIRNL